MTSCWGSSTGRMPSGSWRACGSGWQKFGLELHPEKTRLIEFGRYAAEHRKRRGEGKPETFDFLGFTHICGTIAEDRAVHRAGARRCSKRLRAKLRR